MDNSKQKSTNGINRIPNKRIDLSQYVVGFAKAASQAQEYLTKEKNPIAIKEAEFKINIMTEMNMKENSTFSITVDNVSPALKALNNYKEHFGLEMRFLMVPSALMTASSSDSDSESEFSSDE